MPQIDLDRQIARVRVLAPQRLDFAELAEGVRRNNVGVAGMTLGAHATVALPSAAGGTGTVTLHPTGQTFPLRGATTAGLEALGARNDGTGEARWSNWRVHGWEGTSPTSLEALPP